MYRVEINNVHTAIEAALWCKDNLLESMWRIGYSKVYNFTNSYIFEFALEQDLFLFSLHWVK